ncbi:2Fe-2S iron-sulfur cluster binding domain-containing protein [candidate division KSB1 bacterium]|nr:2Fe-2S iron-sulfur cluster binding domain-containing protein [candidate division KSB1 bacterium]NIR70118.1 2Fe-2S iron-sulfur cluster binding domain-containing protein [candidate division KSB1 bacterium]NIS25893.1 2Fe-2S iron-sulfur cluster binding domain-containing protein [candidate division KSB1 bacterium]NIT72772.1 2Fe-2S iron-sulfur cluster binding domain-containing protein [candidate division KSB1 bacterium]NIU26581.1 2Fe-2S iron-sulfur cluster binding domain-containing protein [candid
MAWQTHFILNNQKIITSESPGTLVLDYLRRRERLVGTKEGCKEGDCGACMVLVGELVDNQIEYMPMTSCLMPVGELHGKHLVTVEGLNQEHLTPVQQAIVDEGGTQCGFCTPGIVVSMTAYLMKSGATVNDEGIKYALGGNLCRCTGYASLIRAGKILVDTFGDGANAGQKQEERLADLISRKAIPEYFHSIPTRLKKIPKLDSVNSKKTPDYFIAGGTDIYVQKGELLPDSRVEVLNLHPEMKGITVKNGKVHLGALTTFEEFADHPEILKFIPNMKAYMHLNASWQIRNRATLGGNIVNASPIGDMTILLLALDSTLTLKEGRNRRTVPLKSFYKGYKVLDKTPKEIVTEITFPLPGPETKIHFEKVSKRRTLDIASVNSAIKVQAEDGLIKDVHLTMGGVAPVPLFLEQTSEYLQGNILNKETIMGALPIAMAEVSPISDVRGSAEYKRLLVRQFMIGHVTKLFPEYLKVRDFYETH